MHVLFPRNALEAQRRVATASVVGTERKGRRAAPNATWERIATVWQGAPLPCFFVSADSKGL